VPDGHEIHRIHEFLPHLAQRQPDLVELLPADERPQAGETLAEWVVGFPQRRLMEICTAWVLESLRRLKERTPLSNVLLRCCLQLGGEFDLADAAALAIGQIPPPGDPRREEIRAALAQAARVGILIHLVHEERYCIPFPMRLSFEGIEFLGDVEQEALRLRLVSHFGRVAAEIAEEEAASPRHWRFANILGAWETAAEVMEEVAGIVEYDWTEEWELIDEVPAEIRPALAAFVRCVGRAIVNRQSESGLRLLAAAAAAARTGGDVIAETEARSLIGQFHLRRSAYEKAIAVYRRNEEILTLLGQTEGLVLAIAAAALAHRELGRTDIAIGEFLRARSLAQANALFEPELDTANCAARLLLDEGRTFETLQLIQSVMESQRRAPRRFPAAAELQVLLAVAFSAENRFDAARDQLFYALGTARQFTHRPAEAAACLEIARLFLRTSEYDEALKWGRRARSLAGETANQVGIAETNLLIARALRLQGHPTDCDDLLLKALRSAQNARAMEVVADIWHERALLRLHEHDAAQAISSFGQEAKALRHCRHNSRRLDVHLRVADLLHEQEAHLAATGEALRAQAIGRQFQLANTPRAEAAVELLSQRLTPEEFEHLVEEITEEVDG